MAELYRFFNTIPGDERTYQAEDFAQFFGNFLGNGFFEGLGVTANNDMTVNVAPGSAMVEGHEYTNTSTKSLTLELADSTNDRIDRIVLRLDRNTENRYIKSFVKKGTVSTNPKPPSLTRDDYIWELSLAQVRIEAGKSYIDGSQITDERGDIDLCGRVQVARKVGDYINTVDVQDVDAKPDRYAEGISQFYLGGSRDPEIMQGWLDSIGVSPSDFGRSLSSLRAYVHTIGNKTNTGLQTFTLFAWDWNHEYEIYGEWKRANNAISASIDWGKWHQSVLTLNDRTEGNQQVIRYSNGVQEINFIDFVMDEPSGTAYIRGDGDFLLPFKDDNYQVFGNLNTTSGISAGGISRVNNIYCRRKYSDRFQMALTGDFGDGDVYVIDVFIRGRWR